MTSHTEITQFTWLRNKQDWHYPHITLFRNNFTLEQPASLSLLFSADERAQVFLDGEWLADGPLRGTAKRWFADPLQTPLLAAGKHTLVLANYWLGEKATAYGQLSLGQGIYVGGPDADKLNPTWECRYQSGCHFLSAPTDWGAYAHILTDEDFNWDFRLGLGGGKWETAIAVPDQRHLEVSPLPPRERGECTDYTRNGDLYIFNDYQLLRGDYVFEGSGEVRLRWVESSPRQDQTHDDYLHQLKCGSEFGEFHSPGDRFLLRSQRIHWTDYWWHAGRTLQISLFGDVKIVSTRFFATGYPWQLTKSLQVPGDPEKSTLLQRCWRTLEMCTCDTMMDCPYYEQLQYISDSRYQMLALYEVTSDHRLLEKAIEQFAEGQAPNGALPCRYPGRDITDREPEVGEECLYRIPSFMCYYPSIVHDYARLHDNPEFIRQCLPACRRVTRYLASKRVPADGLLEVPGWNFIDWNQKWHDGMPPLCERGNGCTLNLIFVQTLKDLQDLELHFGEASEAAWCQQQHESLMQDIRREFYVPEKGMYAENREHEYFSEHAQVWAILALNDLSVLPALRSGNLDSTGIAFSFYYFCACRVANAEDLFQKRMEKYLATARRPEFSTMPECFPNDWWVRSECHAWSSHPLFWYFSRNSILDRLS